MAKVIFDGAGEMPELNKITAKKNYASSSQAHKMGATAMFNDILHYLGKEKYPKLINEVEGQVAVRQHPVYAFQKIPIEGSEGQYNRKFIGLFTVGPDKGDKNYFGFTNSRIKNRAIRLEGTDHLKGVGFNYPWTVNGVDKIKYNHAEESLCIITGSDKTKWTKIWEQSVCGDKETEAEIEAYLKEIYKPAYEVAYHNNPLIVGVDMTLSEINSNIDAFGKRRRVKDDRQYSYCEFWIDGEYDIYYLNAQTNKYEKNGINLLSDLGITADEIAGMTIEEKNDLFISRRVARFKEEAKYYFCIDDAVYQLMFLFIIVASDNFEKNMYPYIMELLWRFFQDDLDSIFSTDNQAQNTKKYSAELHDFTDDTKSAYVFKGEDSAFWQLIELAYGDECKQMGRDIFQAMYDLAPRGTTTMEKLMAFFDEYFFNRAQKYFTPSAYNNDTEYSYEEAWNNKEYVASVDIHPLAQALGSQESTERAFLEKRLIYLMSKFSFGGFGSATDTDLGIISVRTQDPQSFTLTPAIDLYPTVLGGQAQSAVATERVMAGQSVTLPAVGGGNTNVYIVGADWLSDIGDLKDLKVDPSSVVTLTISSKRLRRIKVGDENAESVTSYLGSLSIQKCDSLETIDARNLQTLVGTVDLSNCPRLVEALFGGSNATAIIIAPGSKVEKLQFSDSITTIDLRNNTFLKDIEITNVSKIRFLRLENVPVANAFDVLRQAYNTDGQQLENIRIIGFTYTGGAADLLMLNNIAEGKDKNGNAHIYGSIDANGDPVENSLPVIEGSLHITESVNRSTYDFVQEAFHALALTADNIVDYFIFADPEVSRIVAENWGDGVGTTLEQIEAITNIGTKFANNTLIETFDEFEKFKNVKFPTYSEGVFSNCASLVSIKLPKHLTIIPANFAKDSINMESDITGCFENTTFIGRSAFLNTKIYGELNLPKIADLESAQNSNFKNTNISKAIIGGTVSIIPASCFENCANLNEVILSENVKSIYGNAFAYTGISSINLENVSKLAGSAFRNCASLQGDINMPNYSGSVGGSCFDGCSSLDSISMGDGVTVIEYMAFSNCTNLKKLDIGAGVTSFNGSVVQNNNALEAIIIRAITPPTATSSPFSRDSGCPIYVPDASVEAYKTATNWINYAPRIQSIFYYYGYIDFVDPAVRDICVANFDTDGDGVVSIEEAAAVTDIGNLFKGKTSIESFDEFKYFTGITKTPDSVFERCVNLKNITLSKQITELGQKTFLNCRNLDLSFIKDSNIETFGYYCLQGTQYNEIAFPKTCKKFIGGFLQNSAVTKFVFLNTNEIQGVNNINNGTTLNINDLSASDDCYYSVVGGCLYNKEKTTLLLAFYDVVVPIETNKIEARAFSNLSVYQDVFLISSTITELAASSFENCRNIGKLVIPNNVNNIGATLTTGSKIKSVEVHLNNSFTGKDIKSIAYQNKNVKYVILEGAACTISSVFATSASLLDTLVCDINSVVVFSNGGLNGTKIHSGNGFIYVSSTLVENYKIATNWSNYASQIKPINVADTLPAIGSVAENDLYKIGEVYWKAEMVDSVLTWVEI